MKKRREGVSNSAANSYTIREDTIRLEFNPREHVVGSVPCMKPRYQLLVSGLGNHPGEGQAGSS